MGEPLVVIGNGMAAARFVEELSARALGRHAVAVVGAEPRLAYNRVLLSSLLAGEVGPDEIELRPASWWRACGVTLIYGRPAVEIDRAGRHAVLADGTRIPFARLVLATGSQAIRLPVPGRHLPGVLTFRDAGDVSALLAAARHRARAVVVGGGLLGLEAAAGLAKAGARVTLVHLMDRLMERQLDAPAAALLKRAVEARGIEVLLEAETAAILGEARAEGLALGDGRTFAADLVVFACGVRPNTDLARPAGLACGRGILVDDALQTSEPGIHAVGECAEHRGQVYGLVEPAYEQARVLARRLAGEPVTYAGSIVATNLKVSGVHVFSAGDFMGAAGTEAIVLSDPGVGAYRKLVLRDGRLVGAALVGDTADALWYLDLIRSGTSVEGFREDLVFGRALAARAA